jgi:hypothetical protein
MPIIPQLSVYNDTYVSQPTDRLEEFGPCWIAVTESEAWRHPTTLQERLALEGLIGML